MGGNAYDEPPIPRSAAPPPRDAVAEMVRQVAASSEDPFVFNLVGQEGNFETDGAGQPPGQRSFGFWALRAPKPGDIVIKPNTTPGKHPSVWEILGARCDFTGSDSNQWWKGHMREITNEVSAGRADPQVVRAINAAYRG